MSHVYGAAGAAHPVFDEEMEVIGIGIPSVFPVFVVICYQRMGILFEYCSAPLMDNDHGSYDCGSSQQIDRTVDYVVPELQFLSDKETRADI